MKKSSKNRLTPGQQDLFPSNTLFDKIARAVCRAGTLPRKELHEAWETARRIRRKFRGGRIIDMACGHGLLAHILLILDNGSPGALAVDKRIPDNARHLSQILVETWPRLENRIKFIPSRVEDIILHPGDLVVSAHACGALTDVIINQAVAARCRVAVLPCCHDLKTCDPGPLAPWMSPGLAIDALRALRLQEKNYGVTTAAIPREITPKNRLIMGDPQKI